MEKMRGKMRENESFLQVLYVALLKTDYPLANLSFSVCAILGKKMCSVFANKNICADSCVCFVRVH